MLVPDLPKCIDYEPNKNKEVWSGLFEVAIGIWLLSRQLGAVSVTPVIVILSSSLLENKMLDLY